jgi:hypothetical protein
MLRRPQTGAGQRWDTLGLLYLRHGRRLSPLECDGWFGTTAVTVASDRGGKRIPEPPGEGTEAEFAEVFSAAGGGPERGTGWTRPATQ